MSLVKPGRVSERREIPLEAGGAAIKIKLWNDKTNLPVGPCIRKKVVLTYVLIDDCQKEKCAKGTDLSDMKISCVMFCWNDFEIIL